MKKIFIYASAALIVIAAGGLIWWQLNKHGIIRHAIEKAVSKGTDSTYNIHYDSSRIDAVAGSAVFYNVTLRSDSLQEMMYSNDTAGVPQNIFNVRVEKLSIIGADIPSFLTKNKIAAAAIELTRPQFTLINTGKQAPVKLSAEDTLALYEKILGRFNSIQAAEIRIVNGRVAFARGNDSPYALFDGINVNLKNFRIDSTRNYDNIVSYFINGIHATIQTVTLNEKASNRFYSFENIEYNAPGRFLKVDRFLQRRLSDSSAVMSLANSRVSGISTAAFIKNNQLKADSLVTDGGILDFYRGKKKGNTREAVEMDNGFFDEAFVKNIRLGNTTVSLFNRTGNEPPLVLKNLQFMATDIDSIYSGSDIVKLLAESNWKMSADGLSFTTSDKVYKIDIGPFVLDNINSAISVKSAAVTPLVTRDAFEKSLKFQKDLYTLHFNNIRLTGADVRKLMTDRAVIADNLVMDVNLQIFTDRTIAPDTASKIGQYPQQLLQKVKTPIYIKTIHAPNAFVSYTERGALSKKTGEVIFSKIQGLITNFTNIDSYIQKNNMMTVTSTATFINMATISSVWKLPLNSPDGEFQITGKIGPFSAPRLNPVIEPLGMGSINSGSIKSLVFDMHGNDLKAEGKCTLLYDDLKIKLLKNTGDSNHLQKKVLTSAIANIFIHDKNPSQGNTRTGDMSFKRVTTKTFFNLVWKSIFAGAKSSTR